MVLRVLTIPEAGLRVTDRLGRNAYWNTHLSYATTKAGHDTGIVDEDNVVHSQVQ